MSGAGCPPAARAADGISRLWSSLTATLVGPLDRRLPGGPGRAERGGATVEFVLLLPAFLMVFVSSVEGSLLLVRQVMLERAVDIAVRDVRLSTGTVVTQNHVRSQICERARILPECEASLVVELTEVAAPAYAVPTGDMPCVDKTTSVMPPAGFAGNRPGTLIMLRACYAVRPMLFESTFAMTRTLASNLVHEDGAIRMVTSSAFMVE